MTTAAAVDDASQWCADLSRAEKRQYKGCVEAYIRHCAVAQIPVCEQKSVMRYIALLSRRLSVGSSAELRVADQLAVPLNLFFQHMLTLPPPLPPHVLEQYRRGEVPKTADDCIISPNSDASKVCIDQSESNSFIAVNRDSNSFANARLRRDDEPPDRVAWIFHQASVAKSTRMRNKRCADSYLDFCRKKGLSIRNEQSACRYLVAMYGGRRVGYDSMRHLSVAPLRNFFRHALCLTSGQLPLGRKTMQTVIQEIALANESTAAPCCSGRKNATNLEAVRATATTASLAYRPQETSTSSDRDDTDSEVVVELHSVAKTPLPR